MTWARTFWPFSLSICEEDEDKSDHANSYEAYSAYKGM